MVSSIRACVALALLLLSSSVQGQNRVYVFEEETIQGTIDKPEAFYILSPSNLDYEALEAEESFLEELYETVEGEPFH
jgi:hypothetical protein